MLTTKIGGKPLATLHELQTIYSSVDLFDMIEVIDVYYSFMEIANDELKRQTAGA